MITKIKLRNDTSQNWQNNNPVLSAGEAGYDSESKVLKIGDGVTPWNNLNILANNYDELEGKPQLIKYQKIGLTRVVGGTILSPSSQVIVASYPEYMEMAGKQIVSVMAYYEIVENMGGVLNNGYKVATGLNWRIINEKLKVYFNPTIMGGNWVFPSNGISDSEPHGGGVVIINSVQNINKYRHWVNVAYIDN